MNDEYLSVAEYCDAKGIDRSRPRFLTLADAVAISLCQLDRVEVHGDTDPNHHWCRYPAHILDRVFASYLAGATR